MTALPNEGMRSLVPTCIQPALEYLRKTDPAWASKWVVIQVAEGVLYGHEEWLPFATVVPDDLVETYLHCLETEDLKNTRLEGMVAVIATRADAKLAARVFAKVRELWRRMDAEPGKRHEFESQIMRQLDTLFRRLPDDAVADGVLSSVVNGDPLDIKIAADLLNRVARPNLEPLRIADYDLGERLRRVPEMQCQCCPPPGRLQRRGESQLGVVDCTGRKTRRHGRLSDAHPRRHREGAPWPSCASVR